MKKLFHYTLLLLLIPIFVGAQDAFPLTASVSSKNNTITVTVKNNTQVSYTVRARLSDLDTYNGYSQGNNEQYVVLAPGKTKEYVFTNVLTGTKYEAYIVATTDQVPNVMTSKFFEKKMTITAQGAANQTRPPVTTAPITPTPALIINFSVKNTETDVVVYIKNNTDDKAYAVNVTFTNDATKEVTTKTGSVDPLGEEIALTVSGLKAKSAYTVVVRGSPTTMNGGGFGPKTYKLNTVYGNPGITDITPAAGSTSSNNTGSTSQTVAGSTSQNSQTGTQQNNLATVQTQANATCNDGIDNDGDERADYRGVTIGTTTLPKDPSCITKDSNEEPEETGTGLVPCYNKCDLNDVFRLLNNIISFLIKVILFPVIIFMFIYTGFKYITAMGNPTKTAKLKSLIFHVIGGLIIILCAWLLVRTIMLVLGYTDSLLFFN
jgi:hypothetical protein